MPSSYSLFRALRLQLGALGASLLLLQLVAYCPTIQTDDNILYFLILTPS